MQSIILRFLDNQYYNTGWYGYYNGIMYNSAIGGCGVNGSWISQEPTGCEEYYCHNDYASSDLVIFSGQSRAKQLGVKYYANNDDIGNDNNTKEVSLPSLLPPLPSLS